MKTSYLKNLFNSKCDSSKNNFNIHSVDLDDSDDNISCNDGYFERNDLKNCGGILTTKLMKSYDPIHDKKVNLFSLNGMSTLKSNYETELQMRPNNCNLSKLRQSPLQSISSDSDIQVKNKSSQKFIAPTSMSTVMKTPKKDDKTFQFQSFKNVGLGSPSMKILSANYIHDANKNSILKCSTSPTDMKTVSSPSIAKIKFGNNVENLCSKKSIAMFSKSEQIDHFSNLFHKSDSEVGRCNGELDTFERLSRCDISSGVQPVEEINDFVKDGKAAESNYMNDNDGSSKMEDCKLNMLYVKLKLESEKIKRWKENIEKEVVLKTKKIFESDKIIESLRASNLDLQMRQESISLNYQEEIDCRTDVSKKIENSRQLCNLLKEKIINIEEINLNQSKEKGKILMVQDHILKIINFVSDDIKCYSEIQIRCLTDLKNEVNFKELEISDMNRRLSEQNNLAKIEAENYVTQMQCLEGKLDLEKEININLKIEKDQVILEKAEFEERLINEMKIKDTLLDEKTVLVEECAKLKILSKKMEEDVLNLIKDIDIKTNDIDQLNISLLELNLDYSKYKNDVSCANTTAEISLKNKEDFILSLKSEIFLKEDIIKNLNDSFIALNAEMNIKIASKEALIADLNVNAHKKDEEISNLEELISNSRDDMKEVLESLNNLKFENDSLTKNESILKSSNQDLRDELNNDKSEINEKVKQISKLKEDIHNLAVNNAVLKGDSEIHEKCIEDLKNENISLKCVLEDMKIKIANLNDSNHKLKVSFDDLHDTNRFLLDEKIDEIKDISNKYNTLIEIRQKMDFELDMSSKKNKALENDLDFERKQNEILVQSCEDLRVSIVTKDDELTSLHTERNEINVININISKKNEEYDKKNKEYDILNCEYKSKINSLETFINDLSKDKQSILKSREDLRKELMFTLEQCKNEHDIIEKKRSNEIEGLKTQINSLSSNSSVCNKKYKNKISTLNSHISQQKEEIEKLQNEMKNILSEKNLMSKNFEVSNLSMNGLSDTITIKNKLLEETTSEKNNLNILVCDYESKFNILSKDLLNKNSEIIKLKEIQMEYNELKSSIVTNSPPVSTQVPNYIMVCGSATPKSQKLSSRLQSINDSNLDGQMLISEKQTPQKTPKGILRQPGSASKRRRVLFEDSGLMELDIENCDENSLLSDGVDVDLENISRKTSFPKLAESRTNNSSAMTPKKPNLVTKLNLTDSRTMGRLNNIRKTPSKAPSKLNEKHKKDEKNWFDSDNFFGVNEP